MSAVALKKELTKLTIFTLMTGAMVGMAWAVAINAFLARAGPAIGLSLVIGAFFTITIGLCYAELCAALPGAGGEYVYARRSLGKFAGFMTGLLLAVAYAIMMPVESIIFGRVIYAVAPVLPEFVFSVIVALVFTAVNIIGIRISAIVQLVLTVILFGGIITFVVLGVPHVSMENFSPYFAEGIGGMLLMVPIAMLGFMGFDILPQASEETKEPPYKLVYLIPLSITFVCVVYVSILTIAAGVVNYKVIAQSTDPVPLIAVVSSYMGETGALIILLAGICGLTTTLNAFVVGSSRLLMALGRDRNLPEFLSRVHPRFGTPHWAILVIGLFGVVGSFYGKLITLLDMASTVVIIAYILVCLSLISLRKKEPELQRPYKVPLYPVVPIIAIIGSLIALVVEATLVATIDWIVLVGLVVLGVLYYFASVRKAET